MFKFLNKNKAKDSTKNYDKLLSKTVSLFIHAAKIDENYTDIEKAIIKKAVIDLENVSPDEAEEIIKKADQKEQESNQIIEFTKEVKKKPMDFRHKIIEILWKIVYSDRTNDMYESNLIRRVCGLLYVSDKESGEIKLKVQNLK